MLGCSAAFAGAGQLERSWIEHHVADGLAIRSAGDVNEAVGGLIGRRMREPGVLTPIVREDAGRRLGRHVEAAVMTAIRRRWLGATRETELS